jgi:hypothetical protein
MNKSEYYGPVGVRGTGIWNIATRDGAELRIHGQLSFTPGGTALISCCDCSRPHLVFGCRYTRWPNVFAEDGK